MSDNSDSCVGQEADWKWGLAVLASVFSSAGSAGGMIMQKWAHNEQQALPEDEKYGEFEGIICSPLWWIGVVVLVLVPLPFDLVALTLAPQSIIAPLAGVTLVMVQVIAPWILGETVTMYDWCATAIICLGCALSTAFGSHCSTDYTLDQLIDLFDSSVLFYAELWWGFSIAVTYFLIIIFIPKTYPNADSDRTQEYEKRKWTSICYAYLGGAFAANQNIAFKAVGEMLEKTMGYDDDSGWSRWECYMLLLGVIVLSYLQLSSLNKGLALWKAVKNLPIYNVFYTIMSTSYGGIFYQEYNTVDELGAGMFATGVFLVIVGICILVVISDEEDTGPVNLNPGKVAPEPESETISDTPDGPNMKTTVDGDPEMSNLVVDPSNASGPLVKTLDTESGALIEAQRSPGTLEPIGAQVGALPPLQEKLPSMGALPLGSEAKYAPSGLNETPP